MKADTVPSKRLAGDDNSSLSATEARDKEQIKASLSSGSIASAAKFFKRRTRQSEERP